MADLEREVPLGTRAFCVVLAATTMLLAACTGSSSDSVPPSPTFDGAEPSQGPGALPATELLVACDKKGTTSVDGPVMSRTDGVHVSYDGPFPMDIVVDRQRYQVGDYAPLILSLAPGRHAVHCSPPTIQAVRDPRSFGVTDPSGHWFDPSLDCSSQSNADFDASGLKVEGDPTDELEASARSLFGSNILRPPLKSGYSVRPGAYTEQPGERVVVAVDEEGRVVGAVWFIGHGATWYPSSMETCDFTAIF
jgi:hypothetical protein